MRLLILLLTVARLCRCDGADDDDDNKLQISRIIDDSYSQIHHGVQELAGQNLTLSCDLISVNNTAYDDQIAWGKATQAFIFKNESDLENLAKKKSTQMFAYFRSAPQEVNRAVRMFTPLREDDAGTYFCGSMKYMKFVIVYVVVRPRPAPFGGGGGGGDAPPTNWAQAHAARNRNWKNLYCSERMFKCKSSGGCISPHYVCDKKPDCTDGSDESVETCKGDPCVDKLACPDGRCIPTAWCCDRHLDANCSVAYRPACCPLLRAAADAYDDPPEYFVPYNMTQPVRANGGRYIFITLCILATFFSTLLLLLILGKIFTLAKKARCREEAAATAAAACVRTHRGHASIVRNYNYRARIVCRFDAAGVNDALLVLSDDILRRGGGTERNSGRVDGGSGRVDGGNGRGEGGSGRGEGGGGRDREAEECPPSYTDVMSLEPPPPYTSQDCLNR